MSKDNIGKSFQDIIIGLIYNYMREMGMIQV